MRTTIAKAADIIKNADWLAAVESELIALEVDSEWTDAQERKAGRLYRRRDELLDTIAKMAAK